MNVDYENRTITFEDGTTVKLRKLSTLVIERLRADERGKPKPPIQEVTYANNVTAQEENPNDPEYLEKVDSWRANRAFLLMRYVISEGIDGTPPESFLTNYRENYFPEATDTELKYLWIATLIPDQEEMTNLMRVIMGQTVPTPEGLAEAADTFPSDG